MGLQMGAASAAEDEVVPERKRKVQFKEIDLVEIIEFEDDEESKQDRCYWKFFFINIGRFRDRISCTEEAIGSIFSPEHRERVYAERILPLLLEHQEEKQRFEENLKQNNNIPVPFSSPSSLCSSSSWTTPTTTSDQSAPEPQQKRRRKRNRRRRKKVHSNSSSPPSAVSN